LKQNLARFREAGQDDAAEELRERFFVRMWDVSWFMKMLKQRFSHWFNRRFKRKGTLWEERFRSVLVEGAGSALATIAAYIDLNPVRAGMVGDPKEYRWSGYAEAAGGGRLAREGLRVAVEARLRHPVVPQRVLAEYRSFLFDSGSAREPGRNGERGRLGFSREQIQEVLAQGGELGLADALRCRVRYFCDGAILGSRAFVDRFFDSHRQHFGANRKSGARKMRGIDAPGLFVVRDLQTRGLG
jgi:putative transposase